VKPCGTNKKRVKAIQRPEQPDSVTAVVEKTREQLLGELAANVCKLTGTLSYAVGDRIIHQVASAQVWPKAEDEDAH
jgi:hypothetical protein